MIGRTLHHATTETIVELLPVETVRECIAGNLAVLSGPRGSSSSSKL